MSYAIKRLTIEGFKSIQKLVDFELGSLNVLIGANGAGKSNFVEFLRLVRELVEQRLQVAIRTGGGADAALYLGPKITTQIASKFQFEGCYSYEFILLPTYDNRLVFSEETLDFGGAPENPRQILNRRVRLASGHDEAKLKDRWKEDFGWATAARAAVPSWIYGRLSGLSVYHFHDTSATAGVRRQGAINDNEYLRPNGENLAAVLYRLQQTHADTYTRIRDVVRLAAPFFHDFKLRPVPVNSGLIQLEWLQKDSDYPFRPSQLSDGTLRFICLATALSQPSAPTTMVFDEPELGLHPYALTLLAALFQQASMRTSQQVIVSTQSAQLVSEFDPEDAIVVERTHGESVFRRLDPAKLSGWLEDYSLGELWQKNVFGGGPRNEAMPIPSERDPDTAPVPGAEGESAGDERS